MDRSRVVILNHFSNERIREHLNLFSDSKYSYTDFAKWNIAIIEGLSQREDIDLHIIAPHKGMRRSTQSFEDNGVHYYFFRPELPIPFGRFESFICPQNRIGFPRNRKYIGEFISHINPDIVILVGAENPYYSMAGLDIKDVPLFLQLQTVYANPDRIKNTGQVDRQRWDVEVQLFKSTPYKACSGRMYYDLVKGYNPDSIIFPRRWPISKFPDIPYVSKKYDFVYFARYLNKNKGFDNAIEAMGAFIQLYPEARLLAVGSPDTEWPMFEERIKELGLSNNLEIHGSFEKYTDLLAYVKQARFALLPITMDVLSGTILEAMRMGLPVVTCRTSGTPSLNAKRETVLISDIGNSDDLCHNMRLLFDNENLQERLSKNSRIYLQELDEANNNSVGVMVEQIKAVIAHYRKGIPIPRYLLYNIKDNIDYRNQ